MKRPTTIKKRLDFPVYGVEFGPDDLLVVGGGGGANCPVLKNKMVQLQIDPKKRKLKEIMTVDLSLEDDCVMSVAAHPQLPLVAAGINGSTDMILKGDNQQCRLFDLGQGRFEAVQATCTSTNRNPEEYQKITRFSHTGKYLLTGTSDGSISVWMMPEMKVVFPPLRFQHVQDADVDPMEGHVVITTSKALIVLSIQDGTVNQVIESPRLNRYTQCEYRSCRFAKDKFYAVVNPTARGAPGGFLCVWTLKKKKPYPLGKASTARVSRKAITTFCLSAKGDLLAYASTDLTIGIVDTTTMRPVLQVTSSAGLFPVISMSFDRSTKYLASAGADSSVRVLLVPDLKLGSGWWTPLYTFLDVLLVTLLLHIYIQMTEASYYNL
ncbi:WD40 repeat-like protein [Hesseltinella vesiculosa]|uniref:WD40 repeat-like protein n=1 Tax=Hesseltinella vesiculosa TaxID=101127 RepID=A0A1X2GY68_9FUNG|nr:WD40 repeat-like protein [Hesseltinella vesiculosa]